MYCTVRYAFLIAKELMYSPHAYRKYYKLVGKLTLTYVYLSQFINRKQEESDP